MAGLIACYKGISVGGGRESQPEANRKPCLPSSVLFVINIVVTAVGIPVAIVLR